MGSIHKHFVVLMQKLIRRQIDYNTQVIKLDAKTRGAIEHRIEDELCSLIENEDVKWIFGTSPISSKQDFLLGFVIGKLLVIAWTYLPDATDEDLREVREMLGRRLPEIRTKVITELNI
jgi:hypothetical protein